MWREKNPSTPVYSGRVVSTRKWRHFRVMPKSDVSYWSTKFDDVDAEEKKPRVKRERERTNNVCFQLLHRTLRPRPHYAVINLKMEVNSENASNVFHPHYAEEIWNRRFHSENTANVFRPHYTGEISKQRFHSENASNVFCPHYTGEIWKQRFHSENTANVFCPHYTAEKFQNKGFILKTQQMFFVHTTPEKFENATTTAHVRLMLEEFSEGRVYLQCILKKNYIEDITRWREDMNFMFEWQEQYLTSERTTRT